MIRVQVLSISLLCTISGTTILKAADFSTYRSLKFGSNLATVEKQTGARPANITVVHQRPALIQEIDWQFSSTRGVVKPDPVNRILLSFFNGQLFRMVVTYDQYRIEGMTVEDVIEAISETYGTSTRPAVEIAYHSSYGEVASVIARWEDFEYSYNLVRTGDRSSFALILYSKRLDIQAQAAILEAVRLDKEEAPQRRLAEEKKREETEHLVLDKARTANKPNFRP